MISPVSTFAVEALRQQVAKLTGDVAERDETIRQLREQLYGDETALPTWLPQLTKHEGKVLAALHSGRTLTKGQILSAVYVDSPEEPQEKIIDVFVCRLRRKLADTPILIETVWGQGYRLTPESVELLWPSARSEAA